MLTSFFGKSKPINFFLVSIGLILGHLARELLNKEEAFQSQNILIGMLLILLSVFLILLLDFIIRKNKLTSINTYAIFFFASMMLMIPQHISDRNIILSNFFLFLAFRRILSIQSGKNLNKKIFDSAIWISVASLFYFWSILHFITLFTSIGLIKSSRNHRYFLIPVAGTLTVLILVSTFNALNDLSVYWFLNIKLGYSYDLSDYENNGSLFVMIFMVFATLFAIIKGVSKYPRIAKKHKPNHILLALILLIGLAISLSAVEKSGAELFFLFFPLSILLTISIETFRSRRMKEAVLWLFFITPFILFILN